MASKSRGVPAGEALRGLALRARGGDRQAAYEILGEQVPTNTWVAVVNALAREPDGVDLEIVAHRTLRRPSVELVLAVLKLARAVGTAQAAFLARTVAALRTEEQVVGEAERLREELSARNLSTDRESIGSAPPGAAEIVGSVVYRDVLERSKLPGLARSFFCSALVEEAAGRHEGAAWDFLAGAWACDDAGATAQARSCRQRAMEMFERALERGEIAAPRPVVLTLIAELSRRAGCFDEALRGCEAAAGELAESTSTDEDGDGANTGRRAGLVGRGQRRRDGLRRARPVVSPSYASSSRKSSAGVSARTPRDTSHRRSFASSRRSRSPVTIASAAPAIAAATTGASSGSRIGTSIATVGRKGARSRRTSSTSTGAIP
jgi:hypothetical protein